MRTLATLCLLAGTALAANAAADTEAPAARPAQSPAPAVPAAAGTPPARPDLDALREQVRDTERAFARTMADRDRAAFARFLAPDTIWFNGPGKVLRGPDAVVAAWSRYFETPAAPFSWEPDEVEVLDSGSLASSSGPVREPTGQVIGRFHSIWRRESDGRWRIVFDRGETPCRCKPEAGASAP
jgi:uncharacterized protein (TIGR02246 family)